MKRLLGTRSGLAASTRLVAMLAIGVMVLGTASTAFAGTVSRDHRGPNGAPSGGVTVNGQKAKVTQAPKLGGTRPHGGYRPNGNFESLKGEKGNGAVVRDHRR